jgi:endonuclease/exonuclease/phosphatase family metal-dependent hydrolase
MRRHLLPAFALLLTLNASSLASKSSVAADTSIMTLNIYGWATMPDQAPAFARLVTGQGIDVLAIQEGVDDWQIGIDLPVDYSRAEILHEALGNCWQRRFQVYVNACRGYSITRHERFDLADGPNAVRTGERAVIEGPGAPFELFNLHWDHESEEARQLSADQTAEAVADTRGLNRVVVGDFNSDCTSPVVGRMADAAGLTLVADGGIDCIFVSGLAGEGHVVDARPSDHPAVVFRLRRQ